MKNHKNFDNADGDGNLKALEKVILGEKIRIAHQKGFLKSILDVRLLHHAVLVLNTISNFMQ